MQTDIIQQGVSLLIYGMGTVFVFLTVLVFATQALSAIVRAMATEAIDIAPSKTTDKDKSIKADINADIKTAIKQAIALHRQQS